MIKSNKIVVFSIAIMLSLSFAHSLSANSVEENIQADNVKVVKSDNLATEHTVLIELKCATNCPYCPAQENAAPNLNGDYEYLSLAFQTYQGTAYNSVIAQRENELGNEGFPTSYYDGGYTHVTGGGSGAQANMQAALDSCAARTVADIELSLLVSWLGNAEMWINLDVTNTGSSSYDGHVHIYICEIESRWNNYDGDPFKNALLDIESNADITLGASESWNTNFNWDGNDHGYGDITSDNIRVIACVFDQSTDYTDETVGVIPDTTPPNDDPPTTPSTPSGASSGFVGIPYTFTTSSTEPNNDEIKYGFDIDDDYTVDIWTDFYSSGETASVDLIFESGGTYNIRAIARDQFTDESGWSSPKTIDIAIGDPPDIPPAPSGNSEGLHSKQYMYSALTTDPNADDQISYFFDWGDGTDSGWLGPFEQGTAAEKSKVWITPGTYEVKVKAKDLAGSESAWSDALTVNMGNTPPKDPFEPIGPAQGLLGNSYEYVTTTTDPEGDIIEYKFDWGDGTESEWAQLNKASHMWTEEGSFQVRAKARDNWDESNWGDPITVEILSGDLDVDAGGPYEALYNEEIQFSGSVAGGISPFTWEWDFGDGETSTKQNPRHAYSSVGEYTVSLLVKDSEGGQGVGIATANILVSYPPDEPTITGPAEGKAGKEQEYVFTGSDPDDDRVYLWVEWFDGDQNGTWLGPYDVGEEISIMHTWAEKGDYTIRAKAKDMHDIESDWSYLEVSMPKTHRYPFFDTILEQLIDLFPWIEFLNLWK